MEDSCGKKVGAPGKPTVLSERLSPQWTSSVWLDMPLTEVCQRGPYWVQESNMLNFHGFVSDSHGTFQNLLREGNLNEQYECMKALSLGLAQRLYCMSS